MIAWILVAQALVLPYLAFLTFGPNSTGTFTFDGEEYLVADHWPLLASFMLSWWLVAVTVALGFFRRISWSRYVLMAPLVGQIIYGLFIYGFSGGALIAIAIVGGIAWYFFSKENVTLYFGTPQQASLH